MRAAQRGGDPLVRTYVITEGRSRASRNIFNLVTLITLTRDAGQLNRSRLTPEKEAILNRLAHSAQSVAELAAHLALPVSVVRILLADLMESGHITTRQRITDGTAPHHKLLEDVLAGLRNL